jgi:hypothetical protein
MVNGESFKDFTIQFSQFTMLYSYGDSAGITPASLLIFRIEAEKPNSVQM